LSAQIISEQNQEFQAAIDAKQVLIEAKNERINQLEQKIVQGDDNLEQILTEKDLLTEQVQELENELTKREGKLEQADNLLEGERTANAHWEDQVKSLEKKQKASEGKITELKKTLREESILLSKSEKDKVSLKEQLAEEKNTLVAENTKISEHATEVKQTARIKVNEQKNQLRNLKTEKEGLEKAAKAY
jgi:chromosome segregation ATPase